MGTVSVLDHDAFVAKHIPDLGHNVKELKGFHWKLQSWKKLEKKLTSTEFDCGGHKWRILLFPLGNADASLNDILSLYLDCTGPNNSGKVDWHACAQFALAISNSQDPTISTVAYAKHRFTLKQPDWGFTRFSELRKLFSPQPSQNRPTIEEDSAVVSVYVRVVEDTTGALWHEFVDHPTFPEDGDVNFERDFGQWFTKDLEPVDEAFYSSKDRATGTNACLPQTHVPALRTIRDWVNSSQSSPLFWLCGSAGSGKSTVAYTIAQEWSHSGASFFFSRARLSLRESRLVFQTIAFQLRINYPILRSPISRALEDQGILTANSETQLQKLILDPILQTQADLPKRLVIVIDALDECDDNIIVNIVGLLATTLEKCDPSIWNRLRFLVTSRPEQPLVKFFTELHIPSFDMSTVDPDDREKDICIFLKDELQKLATSTPYELEEKENDIQLLAKISGGVFVAARIAVDFVAFGRSPYSQLQKLRNSGHISGLDVVYQLVLDTIAQESSVWDIFQQIIGTIVLAFAPLSTQALTDLLHIEIERLNHLLNALRAVIHVREGDAIYPIHASLRDFLTDQARCTDSRVFVLPAYHHSMISRACFDCMTSLLQNPDLRNIGLDGKKFVPDDLTYACQYWARHLAESNLDQTLVDRLHDFAFARILYWIERLSLIGDLDLGTSGLHIVIKVLVRSGQVPDQVIELLSDAHRFLEHFGDMLSISAMYTYTAALQLTPATTRLHQQYGSKYDGMALHLTLKWDTL